MVHWIKKLFSTRLFWAIGTLLAALGLARRRGREQAERANEDRRREAEDQTRQRVQDAKRRARNEPDHDGWLRDYSDRE